MENSPGQDVNALPQIEPLPKDELDPNLINDDPNFLDGIDIDEAVAAAKEITGQSAQTNQAGEEVSTDTPDPSPAQDEEDQAEEDSNQNMLEAETTLYYVRDKVSYEFETTKLEVNGEEKTGCWFFTTAKTAQKIVLEEWEDKFVFQYTVTEEFEVPDEQRRETEPCLYKELEIDQEQDKQLFILEDDLGKLKLQDHFLIKHDFIANSLGIDRRRFAVIEQGEIVCSADKSVIKEPRPENDEAGCFFYVTTILPEESVLQDWEDKTLNVYYFNEPMIIPYGADNEPDEFFDDIYIDKVSTEDGGEERIFSYYDDNVMGEYLKNEPGTAEIFLVESDLKKLSYYGSYDLKLNNIKFIHHIEAPMFA